MSKYRRARVAFWSDQLVGILIGVVSIFAASRIGFAKAVNFARIQEVRRTRDLVRTLDHELAVNEVALRKALAAWDSEDFGFLHLTTRANDKAKQRNEYFLVDPATALAVQSVYAPHMKRTLENVRKQGTGPAARYHALDLTVQLERIEAARPLLEKEIARLEEALEAAGLHDRSERKPAAAPPAGEPSAEEKALLALPASEGWKRGPVPYAGAVEEDLTALKLGVAPLGCGPAYISWSANLPPGKKPVRVILTFWDKAPPPYEHRMRAGVVDEAIRKFLGGEGGSFTLSREWTEMQGEVVDPNRPIGWRWVTIVVEDDAGGRRALEPLCGKAGRDEPRKHWWKPGEKALVLPKGP